MSAHGPHLDGRAWHTVCPWTRNSLFSHVPDRVLCACGPARLTSYRSNPSPIVKQGLVKRIGNGETTLIWEQNWLPREEFLRPLGCRVHNPPTRVSELIVRATASWNRELVQATFLQMDVEIILGIPLCTRNLEDFWSWHHERHGSFTVKSAYKMLVATKQRREAWLNGEAGPSNTMAEKGEWKYLWKTAVPGKIRMFLWRLSKHSLPTNDV